MLAEQYLDAIFRIMAEIRDAEVPRVRDAATRVADRIVAGGLFFVYDNGHMLNTELFNRAGGLALLAPVPAVRPPGATGAVRPGGLAAREDDPAADREDEMRLAHVALHRAGVRSGDAILLGSVSGRSPFVVELALEAARRGAFTIALTALTYSRDLPALHPSGRLLHQAADVVLDTHTGVGDAELEVAGLSEKLLPSSGVSAALVAWCLVGELTAALLARGVEPTVFRSVNYPDGPEKLSASLARYRELGY